MVVGPKFSLMRWEMVWVERLRKSSAIHHCDPFRGTHTRSYHRVCPWRGTNVEDISEEDSVQSASLLCRPSTWSCDPSWHCLQYYSDRRWNSIRSGIHQD